MSINDCKIELKQWTIALRDCLESNAGLRSRRGDAWRFDAESLLQKSGMHALSVLDLLDLTKPDIDGNNNIAFMDHYSIQSIVRSVLESYLVFYYVFLDESVGIRVKKLRHKIWHASSLSQRQRQSKLSPVVADLLRAERTKYRKLRREILHSKTISLVTIQEKQKLEKKKSFDWKPQNGWRGIASGTYLSDTFWVDMYNTLSSTAHSSAVVSNNMSHPDQKRVQEQSASVAVGMLNLIIPLFIEGYARIFERSAEYLKMNAELQFKIEIAKRLVQKWGAKN